MFKRKSSGSTPVSESPNAESDKQEPAAAASEKPAAAAAPQGEGAPGRAQARRAGDSVASAATRRPEYRQPAVPGSGPAAERDDRKLVVGQGIRLSGEIKKCEKLVVEGEVEANLNDCLSLEIAPNGLFKGAAVVQDSEISGRFDGQLTVHGRLLLRSTGCIKGDIRYTDLEIQRGGKIAGSIDMIDGDALDAGEPAEAEPEESAEPAPKAAAKPKKAASAGAAAAPEGNGAGDQLDLEGDSAAKPNGSDAAAETAREAEKPSLPL